MRKTSKKDVIKILSIFLIIYIVFYLIMPTKANVSYASSKTSGIDKFPETYQVYLRQLQSLHPNWTFTALNTGLDWNTVIYNETAARHGRNLVQSKTSEWVCSTCGNKVYDGSNWLCASDSAVRYMMDPRNFLNELYIFQFEALSYVPGVHTVSGVEKILQGSFMYEAKANYKDSNGNTITTDKTYAQIIMEAGAEQNISPYHLASRIRQEIGTTAGPAVSGIVSGYQGIYNFYNIGASDGTDAVIKGLQWAKSDTTYGRPWTSPEKSIKGGAQYLAVSYINKGQDTLYLQKFDVDDSDGSLYSHQYMTNCLAPYNETRSMFSTYLNNGLLNNNFNFIIPVFNNMPEVKSPNPTNTQYSGCTEDNTVIYGTNLSTGGTVNIRTGPGTSYSVISYAYNGTPMVSIGIHTGWRKVMIASGTIGYISSDYITTEKPVKQGDSITNDVISEKVRVKTNGDLLCIRALPTVNATTIATLENGTILTRTTKGSVLTDGHYWDKVTLDNGLEGYAATQYLEIVTDGGSQNNGNLQNIVISNNQLLAEANVTVASVKAKNEGKTVIVTKPDGTVVGENELIGTGYKVIIDGDEYMVIKLGDTNSDGRISISDIINLQKSILGTLNLTPAQKAAGIITPGKENASVSDLVLIQKAILGSQPISI